MKKAKRGLLGLLIIVLLLTATAISTFAITADDPIGKKSIVIYNTSNSTKTP